MSHDSIYRDLAERTNGSFLLGVVGPVRTGKSTFIKRFMETLVIPNIENPYSRERAKDELPQSGSGRTIMTAEPKFVPEEAAQIRLPDDTELSVRLIDCVGFMVPGAAGQFEDGEERRVTTPWFDHELSMTEAAELGTEKVIRDHASIGIVITTDGSFGDLPRESFLEAEERVVAELKELGKPFAVVLNSAAPQSDESQRIASEISEKYGLRCLCLNCQTMSADDVRLILQSVLEEFPLRSLGFFLPEWVDALPQDNELRQTMLQSLMTASAGAERIRDVTSVSETLRGEEMFSAVQKSRCRLGRGEICLELQTPRELYYQTLSKETGLPITSDGDLISKLTSMAANIEDYGRFRDALRAVRETGYGVVYPEAWQMRLEEPKIVRQNGKYSVRLRASAPAIHMLMTEVETEVTPAIGGEGASEDIIGFLLQGFEGDVNRIWESKIFGRSLDALAEEGLRGKLDSLPDATRQKLCETLRRIVNEGSSGLICILL